MIAFSYFFVSLRPKKPETTTDMDKKRWRFSANVLLGIFIIVFLFVITEFTDKNSKVLPVIRHIGKSLNESISMPACLKTWMNGDLTTAGFFVGIVCILSFALFAYFLYNWIKTIDYQNRRGPNLKLLGSTMLFLWSIGWALYLQAFLYFEPKYLFVNSELLLRSAVASLDLFMLDIDSNILDQIYGHAHLKGAISFVSLLSFSCTAGMLISLVSARLWAYSKLWLGSNVNTAHSHLYLFWGMNKNMELLAASIRKEDKKSIRIFIDKTKNDEDDGNEGWDHLMNLLSHRKEAYKKVQKLDARLALTNYSLSSLIKDEDVTEDKDVLEDKETLKDKDVWGEIGLNDIKNKINKLGKINDDAELHIFFLSENEAENIESVGIIRKDATIKDIAKNHHVKVVIYCCARLDSVNRVIENTSFDSDFEIRIVDSAHLSVEKLKTKENINLQPVSFVNFNSDATTDSEFNALVVGFHEVGQDIVRFLYEYGAFVSSDKLIGVKRSPFCCHVVDPDMKQIAPHYMDTHLRNGVSKTLEVPPFISLDDKDETLINLHSFGYKDQEFFNLLDDICDKLNYVVIAIGDDIEGVKLAIWILKHVMRQKKDLRNFKILLKSYSFEKALHVNEIVTYYNDLFYAEKISRAKASSNNNNNESDTDIIHVFGKAKDIYSFQCIVSDQLRRESWLYYNSYYGVMMKSDRDFSALSDEERNSGKCCSVSEPDFAWNVRRKKELKSKIKIKSSSDKSKEIYIHKYSEVMSIRRKETQDMENALHRHTKRMAAMKALKGKEGLLILEDVLRDESTRRDASNDYWVNQKKDDNLSKLMTTLAQMEHLRWIASHQMLGYVYAEEKDEAYSEHNCLIEWNHLASNETRGYDYDVVDRSFRLADEEKKECN